MRREISAPEPGQGYRRNSLAGAPTSGPDLTIFQPPPERSETRAIDEMQRRFAHAHALLASIYHFEDEIRNLPRTRLYRAWLAEAVDSLRRMVLWAEATLPLEIGWTNTDYEYFQELYYDWIGYYERVVRWIGQEFDAGRMTATYALVVVGFLRHDESLFEQVLAWLHVTFPRGQ